MADQPYRRARQNRPDSKDMWDDHDAPRPSRDGRNNAQPRDSYDREHRRSDRDGRDYRDRDRDRGRDRDSHNRYRSRSRSQDRDRRDRDWRDRRRDDRNRDDRGRDRGDGRRRDHERDWDRENRGGRTDGREKHRSRSPPRRRSRSPRRAHHDDGDDNATSLPLRGDRDSLSASTTPPTKNKPTAKGKISANIQRSDLMDADNDHKMELTRETVEEPNVEEDEDIVVEDDALADMQAMMGFGGFGTTKQKKVAGNDVYAVRKEKKAEYRQYMNRQGGFNRPLSPSRD